MKIVKQTQNTLTINLGEEYNNNRVIVHLNKDGGYDLEALDNVPIIDTEIINRIHKELKAEFGVTGFGIIRIKNVKVN